MVYPVVLIMVLVVVVLATRCTRPEEDDIGMLVDDALDKRVAPNGHGIRDD